MSVLFQPVSFTLSPPSLSNHRNNPHLTDHSISLSRSRFNQAAAAMNRHRFNKSFNPNRLQSLLTSPAPSSSNTSSSFELNESDLFSSSPDRSDGPPLSPPPIPPRTPNSNPNPNPNPIAFSRRTAFSRPPEGILAALPSSSVSSSPSSSSSSPSSARMIPPIPKPRREFPQAPQYQSAPVNVPLVPARLKNRKGSILLEEEEEEAKSDEEGMLPPHEVLARQRAKESPMTTFSVLEGAGRTLKGRDLRQVRNAVWRRTGFLD